MHHLIIFGLILTCFLSMMECGDTDLDYYSLRPKRSFHWTPTNESHHAPTGATTALNSQTSSTTGNQTRPCPVRVHRVDVGASGNLAFKPNQVEAAVGDIVQFNFLARNHTLTQSEFSTPCVNNRNFDTGFNQFNPSNISGKIVINFEVKLATPQWFYCSQTVERSHCGAGMVFGLNPSGNMEQFIANAEAQQASKNATGIATSSPNVSPSGSTSNTTFVSGAGSMNAALITVLSCLVLSLLLS